MAQSSRLKIVQIVPGGSSRGEIIRNFSQKGGDLVAFSGAALKAHAALLDDAAPLNLVQFGVWVRKCAAAVGATPLRLTSDNLLEEAVGVALDEGADDSPFAAARRFPGTRKAISRAINELSEAGVDGETLLEYSERCALTLAPKLAALAKIALRVEGITRELGFGSLCDAVEVCLPLKSMPGARLERALLIVTEDWPVVAERFCHWFLERGGSLNILVECHATGAAIGFKASQDVLSTFPDAAVERSLESTSSFLAHLFGDRSDPAESRDSDLKLRIVSAPDPLSECEETLRDVRGAIAAGIQPHRLAIFARDMEQYGVPLDAASRRIGVPLALPRRVPLQANGWIRFLLSTLESLSSRDIRALLRPVSSTYMGLDKSEKVSTMERIREAYRDQDHPWETLGGADNPERIKRMLLWRREATADRYLLGEWLGLLNSLRTELRPESDESGLTLERDSRAHFVLVRALNARVSVQNLAGGSRIGLSSFAGVCREVAMRLDVSLPTGHGVPVLSDAESLEGYDRVWVLGLLEGQFPRRRREDPILHDMDREALAALGVRLTNSMDRSRAERDAFYRVSASAASTLTLSYPETDEDRDNIPAFYLEEALLAGGTNAEVVRFERSRLAPPIMECNNDADRNLRAALDFEPKRGPSDVTFETDVPIFAVGRPLGHEPTVKDLRDVIRCPFQFFGRRLLGLHSGQMARRWAGLRQIPVRGKLASSNVPIEARRELLRELEEEITRILPEATDWEVSGFRVGGLRLVDEWIEREFEARRLWREGTVRHDVALQDIDPEGGFRRFGVGGIAPAVTESAKYRVIHLYESRQPEVGDAGFKDPADLLYFGLHLLASYRPESRSMAIEVETQRDGRKFYFLPRIGSITARPTEKLHIKDLSTSDHPGESIKLFSKEVKAIMEDAKARLRTLSVKPTPGNHCAWCDLGELCRRSAKFSEESDLFERRKLDDEEED